MSWYAAEVEIENDEGENETERFLLCAETFVQATDRISFTYRGMLRAFTIREISNEALFYLKNDTYMRILNGDWWEGAEF